MIYLGLSTIYDDDSVYWRVVGHNQKVYPTKSHIFTIKSDKITISFHNPIKKRIKLHKIPWHPQKIPWPITINSYKPPLESQSNQRLNHQRTHGTAPGDSPGLMAPGSVLWLCGWAEVRAKSLLFLVEWSIYGKFVNHQDFYCNSDWSKIYWWELCLFNHIWTITNIVPGLINHQHFYCDHIWMFI
jgi:hypothetical protein